MPRFLEDVSVGEHQVTASIQVSEAESLEFAKRYDPQPMHTGADATVSGWQTTAMVMRLIVDARLFGDTSVLGLGVDELRWPGPLRPGDTISAEIEVLSITPSRSKPDFGVVRVQVTARNQNGDAVLRMIPNLWVPRRQGGR